jgi:hypothetical protein
MSDYLARVRSKLGIRNVASPASLALRPYVQEEAQQRGEQLSLMQPVRLIFDILSRGQYLTANVGQEIIKSIRSGEPLGQAARDALDGAMAGITGKRKGDWQSVLFGGKTEGEDTAFEGLFPDSTLPPWAKKMIGIAANVALDPTTYVSFGATKGAVAGAKKYAEDSISLFLKSLDGPALKKAMTRGFDVAKAQTLASESVEKAAAYISKFKGDLGRSASEVYKKAYKEALRTPSAALQTKMQGEVENLTTPLFERYKAISGRGAIGKQEQILKSLEGLDTIASRAAAGYGTQGGMRAMKLGPFGIGQELFAHQGGAPIKAWDKFTDIMSKSPVGSKLGDAWWAINNKGPLGAIRKVFGVRNPYESYVHNIAQSSLENERALKGVAWKQVNKVVNEIPDDLIAPAKTAINLAEHLNVKGGKRSRYDFAVHRRVEGPRQADSRGTVRAGPRAGRRASGRCDQKNQQAHR